MPLLGANKLLPFTHNLMLVNENELAGSIKYSNLVLDPSSEYVAVPDETG